MISEIAFVNGVMAMWQPKLSIGRLLLRWSEALSLCNLHSLDTISSEYNDNIVPHAKWGDRVDLNAWFQAWHL